MKSGQANVFLLDGASVANLEGLLVRFPQGPLSCATQ